jgi:hypothetical protein
MLTTAAICVAWFAAVMTLVIAASDHQKRSLK